MQQDVYTLLRIERGRGVRLLIVPLEPNALIVNGLGTLGTISKLIGTRSSASLIAIAGEVRRGDSEADVLDAADMTLPPFLHITPDPPTGTSPITPSRSIHQFNSTPGHGEYPLHATPYPPFNFAVDNNQHLTHNPFLGHSDSN